MVQEQAHRGRKGEIMGEPNKPTQTQPKHPGVEGPFVVDARELLQGRKEVWIEHAGVRYRLRVTRRNKLILQK
jgi:hemin uptake protein HemP